VIIFVIGCIILIAAVVITLIRFRQEDDLKILIGIPIGLFVISVILIGAECIYTQDVGEAVVLRNFGGSLAGYTTEAGIKFKAPWQDALNWDIRNRLINFYRDADYAYDNGSYNGATVTINDSSGTKADCDVQVIYSINPDVVERLYTDYGTQEAYVASYVSNDVRQTTRDCAGQFSTIQLLTDKESFAKSIQDTLTQRWADSGVVVESVSVQDIRYDQSITDAYAQAQAAQVEQTAAANQQETARIQGETKVIEAQKESEANQTLAQSLTQEVLMSQYIEALKAAADNGGLIVVPEGSQPIVGTSAN
jgi:regulator of protease activity HflC (stomatin/prohibitin superfamily)